MKVDVETGRLEGVRFMASPNCDDRPQDCPLELIVIHNISLPPGEFEGHAIEQLFTNRLEPSADPYFAEIAHLKVSAHVLIRRDGTITQFVPFHLRAWHAGESSYGGRTRCNDFSIGIELEGTDEIPYEPRQYETLTELVHALVQAYPSLSVERITGHQHIATGRKTDPGPAFDWAYFLKLL